MASRKQALRNFRESFFLYFFSSQCSLVAASIRVGLGLVFFFSYLQFAPDFLEIFSDTRLGGITAPISIGSETFFVFLLASLLVASILTVLGLFTQSAVLILLLAHGFLTFMNPHAFWGWGSMGRHFLLFLFFCRAGRVFSLDAWIRYRTLFPLQNLHMPAWPLRLFQIQIPLIYLITVLHRLDSDPWIHGSALTIALNDGVFGRFPFVPWEQLQPWLAPFSYFGFFLEIVGVLLILPGAHQPLLAIGLIIFHLTLEMTATVQYWQFMMIAALFSFLPAHYFSKIGRGWIPDRVRYFVRTPFVLEIPLTQFRSRRILMSAVLLFFSLATFAAWPRELTAQKLSNIQNWTGRGLQLLGLNATAGMTMFENPRPNRRQCYFALGWADSGESEFIYSSSLDYCFHNRLRILHDEFHTAISRIESRALKVGSPQALVQTQAKVGKYFCARAERQGQTLTRVVFAMMRERYMHVTVPESRFLDLRQKLRVLAAYDCKLKGLIDIEPSEIRQALQNEHNEFYQEFASFKF